MKLGIVGHAEDKFTRRTKVLALEVIRQEIIRYKPDVIISGRSPLGGVDLYAEELAKVFKISTEIFVPEVNRWEGFRKRNLLIAKNSDIVLVVVVKEYHKLYDGMRFTECYHCKGRNPDHVKSGGCWTAWRCNGRKWRIIE